MLSPERRRNPGRGTDWPAYLAGRAASARHPALQRFFGADWPGPETPIGEVPLVALDLETTGLDPGRDAIVSIGLVPFGLAGIRPADSTHWVLRPVRPLSEVSITYHHITHNEVAEAPYLAEMLEPLLERLAGRIPVVHYRAIERSFLDAAVRVRLGEELLFPVIDTMAIEARLHRQSLGSRLARMVGRRPTSIRLYDSRTRYGLPNYRAHHAALDALATAELLQAQVAHHYSPETPLGQLWA